MADAPGSKPSDRNLLYGILALQLDFISRDQLVAAMNAWVLDKHKSLGLVLCEQGALQRPEHDLLDALVQKHLDKHNGDLQNSLAALTSLPSAPRELADVADADVQASVALWTLELGKVRGATDSRQTITYEHEGRFRILRPHARGGLGEVFVALDEELHREVALKEIQDRHAEQPESRNRFMLEAEITGGLEHPGIVPVYSLGQYRNGRPYYAMRFIRGDSLGEAIDQFHRTIKGKTSDSTDVSEPAGPKPAYDSLAFLRLLRRFVDVCNAVAYAHSRGVLHRDLKPGNIMLGKYGETLVVDWGLAKAMGQSHGDEPADEMLLQPTSGSGSTPTQMGSAIGTPAYMSPEQAAGRLDEMGPASDVYGLGATLYHLLTGRPAFGGKDKGEILRQVQKGSFAAPRTVFPSIPRPLEAVCLKSMALAPADRYASTRELADDVEHWLADEPVSALRDPPLVLAGRWARRHRTGVAAAATLLFAAFGAALVGIVVVGGKNIEIDKKRLEAVTAQQNEATQRDKAEQARALAEANFKLARDAVDKTLTGVAGNPRLRESEFHDLRRDLLGAAVPFYVEFVKQKSDEPEIEGERGRGLHQLAYLRAEMGNREEAEADYREMQKVFVKLSSEFPQVGEYRLDLAASYVGLAMLWSETGRSKEAEQAYREAATIQQSLATVSPDNPKYRAMLAAIQAELGSLLQKAGRLKEAEQAYRDNLAVLETLTAEFPKEFDYRGKAAATKHNLGVLLEHTGRHADAEQAYRESVAIWQSLVKTFPKDPGYRQSLAQGQSSLAILFNNAGHFILAEQAFRDAIGIQKTLAADFPLVQNYRFALAQRQLNLGLILTRTGKLQEAERAYHDALDTQVPLASEYPQVPAYSQNLALIHSNLGILLSETGRPKEAVQSHREALSIRRTLVARFPKVPLYRQEVAASDVNLGNSVQKISGPKEAESAYSEARNILQQLVTDQPKVPVYRQELAGSMYCLANLFSNTGRLEEAKQAYKDALSIQRALATEFPKAPEYRQALARTLNNFGTLLRMVGQEKEGEQAYRDGLAVKQSLVADFPKVQEFRLDLGRSYNNLGALFSNTGRLKEAIEAFHQASELGIAAAAERMKRYQNELAIVERLPAILAGEQKPKDAAECIAFALLCAKPWQGNHFAAQRFYADAFAQDAKLASVPEDWHRYNAACSAAMAGCGQGKDVQKLTDADKAKLRNQSLAWLKADLAYWSKLAASDKANERALVVQRLNHWLQDSDLAGVREKAIDMLPEAERAQWVKLWGEVAAALAKAKRA